MQMPPIRMDRIRSYDKESKAGNPDQSSATDYPRHSSRPIFLKGAFA